MTCDSLVESFAYDILLLMVDTPANEKKRSASTAGHISDEVSNVLIYFVNSFAIIKAEEEGHYLAYLDDFCENKKGEKSVKVRWFQHLQEVQCVIPQLEGHPGEIFITPHTQVIYAECIDAPATVLTPEDYERYISLAPEKLFSGVYVCCWEFKNNKVMPFSESELDGYYNQTIFTILSNHEAQLKSKGPMCKVLKVSEKCLKVQYDDIQDYDGPDKLKEWVSSYRVEDSDKLGMRCTGRLTIRPRPPEDFSDCSFELGAAVDAWWSDGSWEGVVVDFDVYGSGHLQVFFPGENRLLEIPK
ncbi:hypothetical protein CQW23_27270 [Capsicum baccatum]|uniref:BAH domain-containing protein n=1 Tax=Capsicum baccatum TaxID=33114 RepID=A0A2G2VD82_CAPBA|nr:hypothetical protein CQW23_27270 [Capsicum baccatum]